MDKNILYTIFEHNGLLQILCEVDAATTDLGHDLIALIKRHNDNKKPDGNVTCK